MLASNGVVIALRRSPAATAATITRALTPSPEYDLYSGEGRGGG